MEEELDIIKEKIRSLPITTIPVNYWEDKKFKPYSVKLIKLDDVLKILELIKNLELE